MKEPSMQSLIDLLRAGDPDGRRAAPQKIDAATEARVLLDLHREIQLPCAFKPGDLVVQKPWLTIYKWPSAGVPALVVHLFGTAEYSRPDDRAADRNDMIIAVRVHDELRTFAVESFRFAPYTGEIA